MIFSFLQFKTYLYLYFSNLNLKNLNAHSFLKKLTFFYFIFLEFYCKNSIIVQICGKEEKQFKSILNIFCKIEFTACRDLLHRRIELGWLGRQ